MTSLLGGSHAFRCSTERIKPRNQRKKERVWFENGRAGTTPLAPMRGRLDIDAIHGCLVASPPDGAGQSGQRPGDYRL